MPVMVGNVNDAQLSLIRGWVEESPNKVVGNLQATPSGEKGSYTARPHAVKLKVTGLDEQDYITLNSCGLREA